MSARPARDALPYSPLVAEELDRRKDMESHILALAWARSLGWLDSVEIADGFRRRVLALHDAVQARHGLERDPLDYWASLCLQPTAEANRPLTASAV